MEVVRLIVGGFCLALAVWYSYAARLPRRRVTDPQRLIPWSPAAAVLYAVTLLNQGIHILYPGVPVALGAALIAGRTLTFVAGWLIDRRAKRAAAAAS